MLKGSLILVGSGITFYAHLTLEAKTYIEQADKVLYLINEPLMQQWIEKYARCSKNLDHVYHAYPDRRAAYHAITQTILDELQDDITVCVVIYGHPCVFSKPGLDAVRTAKTQGCNTKILPGISAADCLFADLLIDPGDQGCQMFDASDFLFNHKTIDGRSHLLLWQIDAIGCDDQSSLKINAPELKQLTEKLLQHYPQQHPVTLYEAALYPTFSPIIMPVVLHELPTQPLTRRTTLYVPPNHNKE